MKKNLLLILLSSVLLVGCDFNLPSLKNKEKENTANQNENCNTQHQQQESGGNTETEDKDELLEEYTATLVTHGEYFNENFKEGTNFNSSAVSKVEELRTYLENPLEFEDLFTSLTCDYCATRKVEGDTYLQIGTGSYAKSKFNEGKLVFGSKVKIYRVKITAFNYSNPYNDPQTGQLVPNVDAACHLKLDDIDLNMELASSETPTAKVVEKSYGEGTTSFTLKATSGRVLIKEMTITWRG